MFRPNLKEIVIEIGKTWRGYGGLKFQYIFVDLAVAGCVANIRRDVVTELVTPLSRLYATGRNARGSQHQQQGKDLRGNIISSNFRSTYKFNVETYENVHLFVTVSATPLVTAAVDNFNFIASISELGKNWHMELVHPVFLSVLGLMLGDR